MTEGNYLASADAPWSAVRGLLRELWYIDAEDDVRRSRLVERHTRNGQDGEAAHLRIVTNDHPNGEYVKACRAGCHWIVQVSGLPVPPEEA
ncbi:hypothetical protein KNE206_75280 [Kitasatospora sp. NE20-6]|uniref:hypothetical protein n=1 Tax=Kitasatospora sp. NE20-6 TaxID=2859066 RepID=UPI0034DB98BE